MKKLILLFVFIIAALTACDKLPEEMADEIDVDNPVTNTTVKEKHEFDGVIQNDITNDKSEVLTSTFLNLNLVMDREFKSGIINDDTLQIILLSDGNPSEEFELFYNNDQETAIDMCKSFDIEKIILKIVDDEDKLIFEITYTENEKSVSVSQEYADVIAIK